MLTGLTIPESIKIDKIRLKLQAGYRNPMTALKTGEDEKMKI
jgi:hypothetical protein